MSKFKQGNLVIDYDSVVNLFMFTDKVINVRYLDVINVSLKSNESVFVKFNDYILQICCLNVSSSRVYCLRLLDSSLNCITDRIKKDVAFSCNDGMSFGVVVNVDLSVILRIIFNNLMINDRDLGYIVDIVKNDIDNSIAPTSLDMNIVNELDVFR